MGSINLKYGAPDSFDHLVTRFKKYVMDNSPRKSDAIKTLSVTGKTITYTRADGTSNTITLQDGSGYGVCDTPSGTTAKVVEMDDYVLVYGGIVAIKFTYNVDAASTLNINNTGAKPIYYRGSTIVSDIIKNGDTGLFMWDNTGYHLVSVDAGGGGSVEIEDMTAADVDALF